MTHNLTIRRIYLDCDGVLADFDRAFIALFSQPPAEFEAEHGADYFWLLLRERSPAFYRHLPLMPDARELFEAVKPMRPIILTGVPLGEWAELHKLQWAAEHFPGTPMVVCRSKEKCHYCQPGDVLIDDRLKYAKLWESAGGVFIHHRSAAESVGKLLALLNSPAKDPA